MSRKSPKPPVEDDTVVAARNRQTLESVKLDEEENRRIKQMRTVTRGVRAFRAVRGSAGSASRAPGAAALGGAPGTSSATNTAAYDNSISMLNQYMSGG
jgi:hypothetical protein